MGNRITRTPEYDLLTKLAGNKARVTDLNPKALAAARDNDYVVVLGEYAFATKNGIGRLDELQD